MATFTSIFVPGGPSTDGTGTVTAGAATSTITLGEKIIFAINATVDVNIIFFNAANAKVPTASNFRIPAGVVATYDLSDYYDSFALFNNGASNGTYWYQILSRA